MTTDSERRTNLIDEYEEKIKARSARTRAFLEEVERLAAQFVLEDKRAFKALEKYESDAEDLSLYNFSMTEPFDAAELEEAISAQLENLETDAEDVENLREQARDVDEDEEDDQEDGGEEE